MAPPRAPDAAAGAGLQPLPRRPPVRLPRLLLGLLVLGALLLGAAPVGLVLVLKSEPGSAWLIEHLPGVSARAPQGALLGDFSAQQLTVALPGDGLLQLDEPAWEGLRLEMSEDPGVWLSLRLRVLRAQAGRLKLGASPADSGPRSAPSSLRLPLGLQIDLLQVGELHSAALGKQPLRDLQARIHLGADAGARHQIELLGLRRDRLSARGSLRIASDAPLALQAELALQPAPADTPPGAGAASLAEDWDAQLRLNGPLARPALRASISSPRLNASAPLLEADAVLLPFAAWPLAEVQARLSELDLAVLSSAAPRTRLSGTARLRSSGLDQPADAEVALSNADAGLWNEGRLPVRSLGLLLRARPDQPQVATLERFEAELGAAARPAGRMSGRGSIEQGRWTLDTVLENLLPQRLDNRAPAMRLSGPLGLRGDGPAPGTAPGPSSGSAASAAAAPVDSRRIDVQWRLNGQLEATTLPRDRARIGPSATPGQAVRLVLDASAQQGPTGALQLSLREASGGIGAASASLRGELQRSQTDAPWQLKAEGQLSAFDPRPWWPGAGGSAWQSRPHRLDGTARVDLRYLPGTAPAGQRAPLPAAQPAAMAALDAVYPSLAPWRGQAELRLRPSLLAGVPIEGQLRLDASGALPGPVQAELAVALQGAGNRLKAELSTRADQPAADRWQLEVEAPALAGLAPVAELFESAAPPQRRGSAASGRLIGQLGGRLSGQARIDGRWPALRSQGRLEAEAIRAAGHGLQRGDLRWQLGTRADDTVMLEAQLRGLVSGEASADRLSLALSGTAQAHQLQVDAHSRLLPPAWVDALGGPGTAAMSPPKLSAAAADDAAPSPTRATLRANGSLLFASGTGHPGSASSAPWSATGWRGTIALLELRSGQAEDRALGLRSEGIVAEARWAPDQATRLSLQPGRLQLRVGPTQAALRWQQLRWQAAQAATAKRPAQAARLDAEAELEPIAVAPLLVRMQPEFGWSGDLEVGGRLVLQTAPTLRADVVIERRRGDLRVTDETGTQALGLSELRLALTGEQGVWSFTQALAGSTIGVAAGAVVARTGSPTTWPDARTPVQGVLELQVANLGTWGTWVPAGWRLGGTLRTSASIGGRLGAPEYTGEIRGSGLSVRNFAEGVNFGDGEVLIALQGDTARIQTFTARAGGGTVSLSGGASFGSAPRALLTLSADKFQLLGRVDRRIVASGQGQLRLEAKSIALDGKFAVDEGLIDFTRGDAPALSEDVVVIRAPAPAATGIERALARADDPAAAPSTSAAQRALALNVRVDLGSTLRLRGRGLDTGLRGELLITSPGGRLAVNGTVSTRGGTYNAYGQKLTIERGSVVFVGAVDNPRLDIEATRPNTELRVGVSISGTSGNPRIRLFSEPELPEVDKLSWLVLGRATEGLGRTDTALLQRAALALLAGEGAGPSDPLTRAIGLDEISVRQTEGVVRETVVSLGKQLSRRWYVGYERGLNATAGTWQLVYRIAQRFTLRAQGGFENSVDLIWTWRWQ